MKQYTRIEDDKYKKLQFQLRSQYAAILNVFKCYGMNAEVDIAIEECIKLAENFGMAVRGKDSPIHIVDKPKRRSIE